MLSLDYGVSRQKFRQLTREPIDHTETASNPKRKPVILKLESCYSRVPRPHLLPAMPETHPTPDPIPIRPRLRRQSPNLRELRTKKTRTLGSRDVLPRLLTRIQDMWLMDLRVQQEAGCGRPRRDLRNKRGSSKQIITRRPVTSLSCSTKEEMVSSIQIDHTLLLASCSPEFLIRNRYHCSARY